jgi:hypothetical protein
LEELTKRIMPSASAVTSLPVVSVASPPALPSVAAVTSQVVSTMDQEAHLTARAEYDVSSAWKTIAQEVSEEVAYVQQQCDHLLGNIPAVQQPGGGSGSGSGAMTTANNAQNQQLNFAMQKAGSGSGSGATTTVHEDSSKHGVMPLAGSGSGSGSGDNDTLFWNPQGGSTDAAQAANWYDQTQGKQGVEAPVSTNPVIFDGTVGSKTSSNSACTWTASDTVASIQLQHQYSARMTLNVGVVLSSKSINNDAASQLLMQFNAPSCTLFIGGGGTSQLTNFNLSGQSGLFELSGGTMTFAGNLNQSNSTIQVYDGTTLNIAGGATLSLNSGASLQIYQGATVNVDGSKTGTRLYNDKTAGSIINNQGTINVNGTAGVPDVSFDIPVLNSGTLNINGGGNAQQAGCQLWIDGQDALTQNSDLDMNGGSVKLSGATTLYLFHSYEQTGGTFQTTDSLKETLRISGTGNGAISGGNIQLGTANTYGELDVYCTSLNMNGEYDPKVNGQSNGQCDVLLFKSGSMNISNGSTLNVTVLGGQPAKGNAYKVIQNSSQPLAPFLRQNLSGLTVNTNALGNGNYELDQQ